MLYFDSTTKVMKNSFYTKGKNRNYAFELYLLFSIKT